MKRTTNIEFVTHLMDFSNQGPMMHAFVIEALSHYADQFVGRKQPTGWPNWISYESWQKCAVEAREAIDARHGQAVIEGSAEAV